MFSGYEMADLAQNEEAFKEAMKLCNETDGYGWRKYDGDVIMRYIREKYFLS